MTGAMPSHELILSGRPHETWLPPVVAAAREFALQHAFTQILADRVAGALTEAGEELIRVCRDHEVWNEIRVVLSASGEVLVVRIEFDRRVPLAPQHLGEYEPPADESAPASLDLLWLHLVKSMVDRVWVREDGPRRSLEFIQYRRSTVRAPWVMGLKPRLKPNVIFEERTTGKDNPSDTEAILHDPDTGVLLRLDEGGAFMARRLDGVRTMKDIFLEYVEQRGMLSPCWVERFVERLEQAGMLETSSVPENRGTGRKAGRSRWHLDVSIPRADDVVGWAARYGGFLVGGRGQIGLAGAGLSGLIPILMHAHEFNLVARRLFAFYTLRPLAILWVYLALLVLFAVHELAHGVACKRFGGRVNRMGFILRPSALIFYCDTASVWHMARRQRLLVLLAGPASTLALTGLAGWLFGMSGGVDSLGGMIWGSVALVGALTLIWNANPFICGDGYHFLMDMLDIPDLRERSFTFLRKRLFDHTDISEGKNKNETLPSRREVLAFWIYGTAGLAFTILLAILPIIYLTALLLREGISAAVTALAGAALVLMVAGLARGTWEEVRTWSRRVYKLR